MHFATKSMNSEELQGYVDERYFHLLNGEEKVKRIEKESENKEGGLQLVKFIDAMLKFQD